jgi:pimeloyl-ACP methyl ester carboxylesterase
MFPAGRPELAARFLTLASGLRVRVVEAGPENGPPVLLVHGWACSIYSFRHTFAPLAAAGFRVLAADLKGHGLSDKPTAPGEYGTEALSAHVVEILDALGVGRATLVGHSMGGALALDVAMRAPERVCRVALLSSIGLGEAGLIGVLRLLTPRALAPLYPHLARRWLVPLVLRASYGRRAMFTPRDVDEYWAPTQFRSAVHAAWAAAHEFVWSPVPAERLRTLRCPALVVFGTRDHLVEPCSARRLVEALPDVRLHLVEGAGHVVMEEAPDEVNRTLLAFLRAERA